MGKLAYYLTHGQFENAGIAIEEEIKQIKKRIDDLTTRICHPWVLTESTINEYPASPIATDKDGKPEGGLRPGDVIETRVNKKRELGLFDHAKDIDIYAYWETDGEFATYPRFVKSHEFKFKFRFPKKDC